MFDALEAGDFQSIEGIVTQLASHFNPSPTAGPRTRGSVRRASGFVQIPISLKMQVCYGSLSRDLDPQPTTGTTIGLPCTYLEGRTQPSEGCKLLNVQDSYRLKKLASAVQLRPWPPYLSVT